MQDIDRVDMKEHQEKMRGPVADKPDPAPRRDNQPRKKSTTDAATLPDPALLRKLLRYDPETGELFWRKRTPDMFEGKRPEAMCKTWNTKFAGKIAMPYENDGGYLMGQVMGIRIMAHRVCWALHHGEWPEGQIDHENHNPKDNRIKNLRVVTGAENCKNMSMKETNTSGHTGVCRYRNRWKAQIVVDRKYIFLGYHDNKESAIRARKAAEKKYGFHENHGK